MSFDTLPPIPPDPMDEYDILDEFLELIVQEPEHQKLQELVGKLKDGSPHFFDLDTPFDRWRHTVLGFLMDVVKELLGDDPIVKKCEAHFKAFSESSESEDSEAKLALFQPVKLYTSRSNLTKIDVFSAVSNRILLSRERYDT